MQSDKYMRISHCINLSGGMAIATRMIVYVTTRECNNPYLTEKFIIIYVIQQLYV